MHHFVRNWVTSVFLPMEISASSERDGKLYLSPPQHFHRLNASSEWRRCLHNCGAQCLGREDFICHTKSLTPGLSMEVLLFTSSVGVEALPLDMCCVERSCGIDVLMFDLFSCRSVTRHTHVSSFHCPVGTFLEARGFELRGLSGAVMNLMCLFFGKIWTS